MPNRGNRGRGRGGRQQAQNISIHDRIGKVPAAAFQKKNSYKFVRPPTTSSAVAICPSEARVRLLSKRFLRSYYEAFDKPGRLELESKYSADAFFSFSATYPVKEEPHSYGRNLLEVREPTERVSLLIHNKTNIAAVLALFQPTEHLIEQLSCDVPYYILNPMFVVSMHLVVTGIFKATSETTNPLKAFSRVFILKQVSVDKQGDPVYEIYNDLFMLQPPTPDQIKRYHQNCQVAKRLSSDPQVANSSNTHQGVKSREEMLKCIMVKTRMNREGSRTLLEDFNWDENGAMEAFQRLYAENKIPQNYFTP